MRPYILIVLVLIFLSGCTSSPWKSAPVSAPPIIQCDAALLAPCEPLVADASNLESDANIADAENRGRHIACQISHAALATCLCALERGGIVKPAPGQKTVCRSNPVAAEPLPSAAHAREPPLPAH
jgi:hypothetical protein